MPTPCQILLLLSLPFLKCNAEGRLTVIHLANGGTSRPMMVGTLDHDHSASMPNEPQPHDASDITTSASVAPETTRTSTSTSTSSTSTLTSTTSTSTSTSTSSTPATTTSSATSGQPQTSQATPSSVPPLPCHQSCLEALNSTHLIPNDNVALTAGSSLTLECHMPLVPDLFLEDLLWLFHPGGSPEGRCSLTPHKSLHSCPGFPALSETDYNNGTYLQQVLTLSSLGANHTGDYMCQVRVTCCPGPLQHLMAQQQEARVSVTVWWSDYSVQLAATGVVAAVLLLGLIGVSLYGWRQGRKGDSYEHPTEVEAQGVLHLPLIDDRDTDSFDSSIAEEQD